MITAQDLMRLLRYRHADDVFVEECKDGPSQGCRHLRMDAWVMARSWSQMCVTVYETKVSRSDFLKDNKWRGYLPMCNALYFCAPKGLIAPGELPEDVGLIEATTNAARLITRRKAVYRDVDIPESVYRYILMCRARIQREQSPVQDADYWREWLKLKDDDHRLGADVRLRMGRGRGEQMRRIEQENTALKAENKRLSDVREALKQLGFDDEVPASWQLRKRIEERGAKVPRQVALAVSNAQNAIEILREWLKDTEQK